MKCKVFLKYFAHDCRSTEWKWGARSVFVWKWCFEACSLDKKIYIKTIKRKFCFYLAKRILQQVSIFLSKLSVVSILEVYKYLFFFWFVLWIIALWLFAKYPASQFDKRFSHCSICCSYSTCMYNSNVRTFQLGKGFQSVTHLSVLINPKRVLFTIFLFPANNLVMWL